MAASIHSVAASGYARVGQARLIDLSNIVTHGVICFPFLYHRPDMPNWHPMTKTSHLICAAISNIW